MSIYPKKIYLLLLIIIFPVILISCQPSKNKQVNNIHLEEKLISMDADAGTEFVDAAVSGSSAYLISASDIIKYDLISGERTAVAQTSGNTVICAYEEFIYTYNQEQNAVIKYDKLGEVKKTYPCSFNQIEASRMCINNDTIIISAYMMDGTETIGSELYKLDLGSEKSSRLPDNFKGNDSFSLIVGLDFTDSSTIMISSVANTKRYIVNPIFCGEPIRIKAYICSKTT